MARAPGIGPTARDISAALLVLALPTGVLGQTVEPRLLLVVDTSGSMAWEACDPSAGADVDHTNDCPGTDVACGACAPSGCGDGVENDGRVWKVKRALTDVVNAFGEAEFALARFHGTPAPFSCAGGGWIGAAGGCVGAALGAGDNAADVLVAFAGDNQQDLLEWLDLDDNFGGVPPDTGCILCPGCGGGCDKELRPTGATPLAGSLDSANAYVSGERAADPRAACRPYGVILIADGANSCGDPANPADPDPTPEQAAALCASGVPVHVIGFAATSVLADLDAIAFSGCNVACDDQDGDGAPDGRCSDVAWPVDDETELGAVLSQIVFASIPDVTERCNAVDDDCDYTLGDGCDVTTGLCKGTCQLGSIACIDEDPGPGCTPGSGPCLGQRGPAAEVCNCIDDDCDGQTDEQTICPGGGCCEHCGCPNNCNPDSPYPCPLGFYCDCGGECGDGCYCRLDTCYDVTCGPCEECPTGTGTCVPKCDSIECAHWQACSCDACVDASCTAGQEFACDEDEICDRKTHECIPDPCSFVECPDDHACRSDGTCGEGALCVPVCSPCGPGETCRCGRCEADPCASVECAPAQTCCGSTCVADPCPGIECAPGEICDPCSAGCAADACIRVTCPVGTSCRRGECWELPYRGVPSPTTLSSGGGGCACGLAPSPPTRFWLVLFAAGLATAARPRRRTSRSSRRPPCAA
jgi:hypothetical protein